MFTFLGVKLFGQQSRRSRPQRRRMRELQVESLGRRDLLAADLASSSYDSSQVVVIDDIAQNSDVVASHRVQIAGKDALEPFAVSEATSSLPRADDAAPLLSPLACVAVRAETALLASMAGDLWALGRGGDSRPSVETDNLLNGSGNVTSGTASSTNAPAENVLGDKLRDRDVDDVMVGGIDDGHAHGSHLHGRLHRDGDLPLLSAGGRADLFSESAGNEVAGDLDDPDLTDEEDADETLVGPEDDLELVAMAASGGGGYGGYGGEVPEISGFVGVPNPGGTWTFTGDVSDDDEDPTGLTVTLQGGIIQTTTVTVAEDDTFGVAVEVPPGSFGHVSVTVVDEDGNVSVAAWFLVDDNP